MATIREKTQILPLRLELDEAVVRKIAPGSASPEDQLSRLASQFLKMHADGGVMLRAQDIDAVQQTTGVNIRVGSDVVKALNQPTTPRKDGALQVVVSIDPSYEAPLNEIATTTGMSVDELVNRSFNYGVAQGFLLNLPDLDLMAVTTSDHEWMDNFMGKRAYSLAEVLDKVRAALGA